MITLHPYSAKAAANQAHLRIMETTDLHVHVFPYDYYADRPSDTMGLSRTASIIQNVRAEATNTLLVDNGDFLQGNPMGDYIAYQRGMKDGDLHPVIKAMNVVGFEVATIGNHEFNYGLDFLMKSAAGADFPIVLANIALQQGASPRDDTTLFPPYVILDRLVTDGAGHSHAIKLGVIGFTPPQVVNWDRKHLQGKVTARDIIATAEAYVPQMREQGADIVIALSHSGINSANRGDGMENASVPLAALDGIDALATGHSHLVFPSPIFHGYAAVDVAKGTIHGKPAVMGGFWGSHLGLIDLLLERDGGTWRVVMSESQARPIARRNPDRTVTALVGDAPEVIAAVQQKHDETLAYIRRPVGKTSAPLHSYFALVADDPSVQIVSVAQQWYTKQMLAGSAHDGLPVLSAAAPFKAGGRGGADYYTDVAAGDLAIKNVADLYLYPNTLRAVKVTGAQLKGWLERSAGMFNQIAPGAQDARLLNPDFPSYNFDVIYGVTYQIDLSRPSRFNAWGTVADDTATRIRNLAYNGTPVTDDQIFVVATNNYRAGGGGGFPGASGDTIALEAPDTNRDVLVRYIVEQDTITPTTKANWSFAPMPGTTVLFETGPKARAYLAGVKGMVIEDAGDAPDGFVQFRIRL